MYTFWTQLQAWLATGELFFFMLYFIFVWVAMTPRSFFGRRFHTLKRHGKIQNYPEERFRISALVTVYREAEEDLDRCLQTLAESLEHGSSEYEIVVALDGVEPPNVNGVRVVSKEERVAMKYADRIIMTNHRNKRKNLRDLVEIAQGDILVLVDSDTFFETKSILELCKPFADQNIGGVTTAQRVYEPGNWMQRISDWMENARLQSSMASAARFTQVACLPGRAIALRKVAVETQMDNLVNETFRFLGEERPCISGDDRYLTNVLLKYGWRTTLAPDSRVTTIAPTGFRQTSKMWIRWGRSSQRYTFQSPWLLRYPMASFIYWTDIFMAPLTTYVVLVHWPLSMVMGSMELALWQALVYAVAGVFITMSIRQMFHLMTQPKDFLYLPVFILVATYLQVLRAYALFTMFKTNVWGTRAGADARIAETVAHTDTGRKEMRTTVFTRLTNM